MKKKNSAAWYIFCASRHSPFAIRPLIQINYGVAAELSLYETTKIRRKKRQNIFMKTNYAP